MAFIMFDYDKHGNIFNEIMVDGVDKPEKIYENHVDHYGDIRDNYQTIPDSDDKNLSAFDKAGIE